MKKYHYSWFDGKLSRLKSNKMKAKTCTKGYSCGLTCINRERSCSKELTGQSIELCSQLANIITSSPQTVTQKMRDAVRSFTSLSYTKIREQERNNEITPQIRAINSFLEISPKFNGAIFRGLKQLPKDTFKLDSVIELDAMSSFSADEEVATGFSKHTQGQSVVLRVNKNKAGVDIRQYSKYDYEKEVLVPKGTKYQVVSIEDREREASFYPDNKFRYKLVTLKEV